jgi:glycosyltransferase involved in cell wall biosynthesis
MNRNASVIIPMHNAAGTIREQLDGLGVATQHTPDAEIIVVDNRSTDDGAAVVADWVRVTGASVRIIEAHDKAGEPYARNVGWQSAESERILFCDADDVVSPPWVRALVDILREHRYATGPLDTVRLNDPRIVDLRGQALFHSKPMLEGGIPFAHGCNMGFQRRALEELGGFDESFLIACDIEIAVRAWTKGIELKWVEDALVHYRLRSTVTEVYRQARAYGRSRRRIGHLTTSAPGRVDWGHQLRRTGWLARHLPDLGTFGGRMKWAWVAGQVTGELEGRRPWKV